jgi:hypothetical protein
VLIEGVDIPSGSNFKARERKSNPTTALQAIKEPTSKAEEYVYAKRNGIAQSVAFPSPELNPHSVYSSVSTVKFSRTSGKHRDSARVIHCRLPVQIPQGSLPKAHLLKYVGANHVTTWAKPLRTYRHAAPTEPRRMAVSLPRSHSPIDSRPNKYQDATTWTSVRGHLQPNTAA